AAAAGSRATCSASSTGAMCIRRKGMNNQRRGPFGAWIAVTSLLRFLTPLIVQKTEDGWHWIDDQNFTFLIALLGIYAAPLAGFALLVGFGVQLLRHSRWHATPEQSNRP